MVADTFLQHLLACQAPTSSEHSECRPVQVSVWRGDATNNSEGEQVVLRLVTAKNTESALQIPKHLGNVYWQPSVRQVYRQMKPQTAARVTVDHPKKGRGLTQRKSAGAGWLLLCVVIVRSTEPYPVVERASEEKYFINTAADNVRVDFPSLDDEQTVHLSVIVPAFDEETRLPPMLDECLQFLSVRSSAGFLFEVIVVSDGSHDSTASVARKYTARWGPQLVRVLELTTNRGKGGAVCLGMMSARGAVLLFADADGATKFSDFTKLEGSLKRLVGADYTVAPGKVSQQLGIVCGSRAHLEKDAIATRSLFRTVLMLGFHLLVWLLAVRSVRDTQCGFKLLTRRAARICFSSLHVQRWAFDVELLYIAERLGIPVEEVAVTWTEIEGSKVVPVWSWLQMGRDLVLIWLRYLLGAWRLKLVDKAE
ncbi:hypothetical protein PR048_024349 [Dryococelus australis]|uniref:dolichyl-phosphate beta-glucosyltransferase n=1 Tax=Dryococelus australis TaxID=614101 RepID=A0ABQ9GNC6_9NEOP|nr:hypothetical protein PR048_024349 [Dryococelus australis]